MEGSKTHFHLLSASLPGTAATYILYVMDQIFLEISLSNTVIDANAAVSSFLENSHLLLVLYALPVKCNRLAQTCTLV